MNEVVALLADSSPFDEFDAPHVRAGAVALARAVLSRGGRLLVYADSPTMLLLTATATEHRIVQNVETVDRRIPPIIVAEGLRSNSVEDRLIDRDIDTLGDLAELERFGVVENMPAPPDGGPTEGFERYSPIAVFLLGRGDRLSGVAEQALSRHRRTQMLLYSDIDVPWTRGWNRIDEQAAEDDWSPMLEGRLILGEDAEVAARADNDARIALAVETIIDRLISDTR